MSDANKLQDNEYYQNYSYVIRSGVSSRNWMEVVKNTVHPAGMAVFGELTINEFVNYGIHITPIEEKLHLYEFFMDITSVQTFVFEIDLIKQFSDTATQKSFDRNTDYLVSLTKPIQDQTTNSDNTVIISGKNPTDSIVSSDYVNRDTDIIVDYVREPIEVVSTGETITFGALKSTTDYATQKEFDRDTDYIVDFAKLITYQDDLELVGDYVFDSVSAYFAEDYVEEPGINQIKVNSVDVMELETGKNVSESVTSTDQINNVVIHKVLQDTTNASDAIDSISPMFMIPNDDPIVTDIANVAISKNVSDNVTSTDAITLIANKNITESIPHGVNEDISLVEPGKGAQSTLHTMEHIYNDTNKNTSDITTTSDSGIINIQDYWSDSYSAGAYVGNEYTF